MDLTQCIRRDRATRSFADDPVSEDAIRAVIDAARRAGSAKNTQPWSFVVVRDRDRLDDLAALGEYTTPLRRAPVGIVLLVDASRGRGAVFDCGRAFQNLKLRATDLGLGSVPQGVDGRRAADLLEVPDRKEVLIAAALGHPDEEPSETIEGKSKEDVLEATGREPVDDMIHWETHG